MRWPVLVLLGAIGLVGGSCARRDPDTPAELIVFAAASTTDVLKEAGRRFEARTGIDVVMSLDSSSSLAKQIRLGAPADVFVSANVSWMDDAEAAGVILADSRRALLANGLVLVAPTGRGFDVELANDFEMTATLPGVRRIAVGDPAHVPAGLYARQALESLGWWAAVEPLIVPTLDVRAALRLVEIGEADAGIVYATDAGRSNAVEVVAVFPPELHDPIHYPIARCTDAPAGAAFLDFLGTDEMKQVFEAAGFRVETPPGAGG